MNDLVQSAVLWRGMLQYCYDRSAERSLQAQCPAKNFTGWWCCHFDVCRDRGKILTQDFTSSQKCHLVVRRPAAAQAAARSVGCRSRRSLAPGLALPWRRMHRFVDIYSQRRVCHSWARFDHVYGDLAIRITIFGDRYFTCTGRCNNYWFYYSYIWYATSIMTTSQSTSHRKK